ncbi:hypothetical protein TL16_g02575 [Triparma laevis f. inornata]|uniref:Uncharacterized protein n=1 Tax=Triparma laevis f. inornata TaxID=1714386 RepID=A0A9W6ZTU7_9STRA|nr:hypothetical protein TL16_g02575 [Triparma laevis f. inornata]
MFSFRKKKKSDASEDSQAPISEEDKTTFTVDGENVGPLEALSDARKQRMKYVTRLTFLLNITQVGVNTCYYAINLTVVHLPEGILHILRYAFQFCSNLTGVRFPKSLISIGDNSFDGCSNLGKVDLRHTLLQELGKDAFSGCSNLESLKIPDTLQKLGENVFYNCSKLVPPSSTIKLDNNNEVVDYLSFRQQSDEEKITLNIDGKDASHDAPKSAARNEKHRHATKVLFILNITKVGRYACYGAANLVVVEIPEGIEKIVFQCTKLVPSPIQITDNNAVAAYLRWKQMPAIRVFFDGKIEALKAALEVDPNAPFLQNTFSSGGGSFGNHETCEKSPFQLSLDKPVIIKTVIQTLPDATIDLKTPLEYAKAEKAPKLIVEMLELLTVDEMKACDTEADIKAAVNQKKATLGRNESAMADIVDYTAREKATVLQTKMFGELGAANVDAAQTTFGELKGFCGDQAERLGDLIAVVMHKYKTTDPARFEPFKEVKDIAAKEQTPPPSSLPIEEKVKFQLAKATWHEDEFQAAMNEIAAVFNGAKSCEEICDHFGIDNSDGSWSKELRHTVFELDSTTDEVVKTKFGPPKGFPRALEKMQQGKNLRDLNRVTFEFEDPLLMALCFEVLDKKYNIHGLKNKYLQEMFKEPPNLHMNLDIRDGWLCEVQMLFRDILLIKKELHKFYDVNRADLPFTVAGRLFKSFDLERERFKSSVVNNIRTLSVDSRDARVNARHVRIVKMKDDELEAKDDELRKKGEELKKKDEQIMEIRAVYDDEMKAKMKAKYDEMKAKDDELRAKEEELKAKEIELKAKTEQLAEIQAEADGVMRLASILAKTTKPPPSTK